MRPYPCGHPRTDANTVVKRRKDRPCGVARRCKICAEALKRQTPSAKKSRAKGIRPPGRPRKKTQ